MFTLGTELETTSVSPKTISISDQVWQGMKWGAAAFPLKIAAFEAVRFVAMRFFPFVPAAVVLRRLLDTAPRLEAKRFVELVFVDPFQEEVLLRFGVQNVIRCTQNVMKPYVPEWVVSPTFRIIATGTLFGAVHLIHISTLGVAGAIAQAACITLFPVESILYEKSGFLSAYAAHATHNVLALFI